MERQEYFESNGIKIYGTLTLPNQEEKPPACLLIGGSFPQTRDGNLDNSQTDWFPTPLPARNLFRDEAKILEKIGVATFRYDKRGCGESEGDFNTTSLFDLVADASNALQWLRSLAEIDQDRIGILGQSEGAVIALMVAAQNLDLNPQFHFWDFSSN
ncbi:MAG: CocE/NonD family hydrolase [Nostocaceae cyanobacterium]|nr:CocE/NonD family hydrolase [Nostocaceae cyanobacterium]